MKNHHKKHGSASQNTSAFGTSQKLDGEEEGTTTTKEEGTTEEGTTKEDKEVEKKLSLAEEAKKALQDEVNEKGRKLYTEDGVLKIIKPTTRKKPHPPKHKNPILPGPPRNAYGCSKLASEIFLNRHVEDSHKPGKFCPQAVVLRLSNMLGDQKFLDFLKQKSLKKEPVPLLCDSKRSFVLIDDVVRGVAKILCNK